MTTTNFKAAVTSGNGAGRSGKGAPATSDLWIMFYVVKTEAVQHTGN